MKGREEGTKQREFINGGREGERKERKREK